jgi:hypothetical protein
MKALAYYPLAFALLAVASGAHADARTDYYQRAAARDTASFHALDVDHDGRLTHAEIMGDIDFGPRFVDMDINRDGFVTQEELQRYIREHYGIGDVPAATPPGSATSGGKQ